MREECKSPTPGWTLSPARKAPDDEVGRLRDELAASRREMRDEVERLTLELVECRADVYRCFFALWSLRGLFSLECQI